MNLSIPPGDRLTKQRKLILETVKSMCFHPTAEDVFKIVKQTLSTISFGTIYRNLDYLTKNNFIKRIDLCDEPAHYDGHMEHHCHFVCLKSHNIYDLPVDLNKIKKLIEKDPLVHEISDVHLMFYGKCSCSKDEMKKRKGHLKL